MKRKRINNYRLQGVAFNYFLDSHLNRTSRVRQSIFTFNLLVFGPLLQLPLTVVGTENGDALNSVCRRSITDISISVVHGASEKLFFFGGVGGGGRMRKCH